MTHKETLQSILKNAFVAGTGGRHLRADCPFCGKEGHFYINIGKAFFKRHGKYVGCWDCKKCKRKGPLPALLKKLDKLYLIKDDMIEVDYTKPLTSVIGLKEEQKPIKRLTEITPPVGWKRMYDHPYLRSRGWTDDDFEYYHVGMTKLLPRYRDRIILMILEDYEYKAFVARSLKTKEWIKDYNRRARLEGKRKYLRYDNSEHDFGQLLFGIDDIVSGTTHTVIVVEGPFDKQNVDLQLQLREISQLACVCSFGNTLSPIQAQKLLNKGVRNIIILYDPDAVKESKNASYRLQDFDSVLVGYHSTKDPGELNQNEMLDVMDNLQDRFSFYRNTVQKL